MSEGCIVITGAGGALGGAVARHLVSLGEKVALLDREGEPLRALAASLGQDRACAVEIDVTNLAAWDEARRRYEGSLGPAAGAVLAAGGWRGGAPFHTSDDATWTAMLTGNLETVRRALQALLPGFVARGRGSVVVVGSRVVERPWTGARAGAYTAAKAAVVALAQAVAAEVLPHGVRVNAVLPSTLDTPANRKAMPSADFSQWVSLDSAARTIAFLLSDGARDISGAALPLYGKA